MTPQEREVIGGIFERLKQAETQPRDPEAERHIAELIARQPYAPYVLAQSVYVQEQALNTLNQQVQQLQAQVAQLQQAQQQQTQQSGGFLSGLFGGGAPRPQPQAAPQPGPWGGQPQGMPMQAAPQAPAGPWGQPQPQQRAGSGFLGTALTTAAGVAGGMVVGNMLMNAFSGHGSHGQQSAFGGSGIEPMNSSTTALPASNVGYDAGEEDDDEEYDAGYDGGSDSYDA